MKNLLLLLLILSFSIGVNAQTVDKKWGIGAGLGAYGTFNNGGIGLLPELYFSRYLSPRLDLMLKGDIGLYNSKLMSTTDFANAFMNLRFKLSDESKNLRPYLFAGPGFLADNRTTGMNFDLGLGAKYYISPATALKLDLGYIYGIESTTYDGLISGRENLWKASIGIEFDFGKAKDSDLDGVSDNKDKCPDTPAGVAVDAKGCPVDTDGDGIADYMDDCPTIKGLVSLKGCPDSDKDGIADKDDACPEVAGLAIMKGCPDTDGDGIADKDDKCPDTKKGYKVDASGCPLDTDKDGIIDDEDECPTVAGTKENKGCPVIEKTAEEMISPEMQIDPVYFDYDNSDILQVEKAKITKLVKLLKSNSTYNVDLTGNADNKGTEEYNMKLSEKRINSVIKAISKSGVKATRISKQKPLGETKPAATNDTEEGRALNRRVTFEVIKTK